MYNFGYKIKLAKYIGNEASRKGLYIMTKYAQDQMADYLPDGYRPHFFFDPVQLEDGKYPSSERLIDNKIKHFVPTSGY